MITSLGGSTSSIVVELNAFPSGAIINNTITPYDAVFYYHGSNFNTIGGNVANILN